MELQRREEQRMARAEALVSSQPCRVCVSYTKLIQCTLVVTSLTTQRNAVAMLYERMQVLLKYIAGVINGKQCEEGRA